MTPLIDGDILRYEIASCGQFIGDDGELVIRPFEPVAELLERKVEQIKRACEAEEEPILFLTNSKGWQDYYNKRARKEGREEGLYLPNYREAVAVTKPYKGNRPPDKPYHFHNLTVYMDAFYKTVWANGLEADDLLGVHQTEETVICSRDKDLRMIPGWHYGWECGRQPEFEMQEIDEIGFIELSKDRKKISGGGIKFFFSQMLTGDTTDNIPGLEGCGPAKAYALLSELEEEDPMAEVVRAAYQKKHAERATEKLQEMSQLLWIARELTEEGEVVPYDKF